MNKKKGNRKSLSHFVFLISFFQTNWEQKKKRETRIIKNYEDEDSSSNFCRLTVSSTDVVRLFNKSSICCSILEYTHRHTFHAFNAQLNLGVFYSISSSSSSSRLRLLSSVCLIGEIASIIGPSNGLVIGDNGVDGLLV